MKNASNIMISDVNLFRNIIKELEDTIPHISEIFENQSNEMMKIDHTEIWTGKTQEKVTEKYNELKKCYSPVKESLNLYIEFLKHAIDEYEKLDRDISRDIETNLESLNVN